MTQMTKNQKILISVGLAIIIIFAGIYFRGGLVGEKSPLDNASSTINIGNLKLDSSGGAGQDGVTVKIDPIGNFPPAPKFPRKITYLASYSSEARIIMDKKVADLVSLLNKNSRNIEAWLDMGIVYKQVGDYEGAREAWEYVGLLSPNGIVSFSNLGDLHHYYLKDYPKSENSFLKAIKNDSKYILSYINLHELYKFSYQTDTNKAVDVLKQGVSANPGNIDLLVTLASYYRDKGDSKNARIYYEESLQKAKDISNQVLVDAINAEINALK